MPIHNVWFVLGTLKVNAIASPFSNKVLQYIPHKNS